MHKNLKRAQRLEIAKEWILQYSGKKLIRGYRKHFDVPSECAIQELLLLQVPLTKEQISEARKGQRARANNRKAKKEARKNRRQSADLSSDFLPEYSGDDDAFYFIAGYTDGGFPYGITWGEIERMNDEISLFSTVPPE